MGASQDGHGTRGAKGGHLVIQGKTRCRARTETALRKPAAYRSSRHAGCSPRNWEGCRGQPVSVFRKWLAWIPPPPGVLLKWLWLTSDRHSVSPTQPRALEGPSFLTTIHVLGEEQRPEEEGTNQRSVRQRLTEGNENRMATAFRNVEVMGPSPTVLLLREGEGKDS